MVIRYMWYLFESRSSIGVHSTNMYAPVEMMHMMNGLMLDKVTFDTLNLQYEVYLCTSVWYLEARIESLQYFKGLLKEIVDGVQKMPKATMLKLRKWEVS